MKAEREPQVERLLEEALAVPAAEREAFVARAAAGDAALQRALLALLAEAVGQSAAPPSAPTASRSLSGRGCQEFCVSGQRDFSLR